MADIDPYAVLGVARDASLPEIKSAHRKRVLKCHPDKIKEESLRNQAQDEFQRVQHAYETLSDPSRRTKYDQKVRLAELRREMKGHQERSQARASAAAREYRDGRIYEERTPAGASYGDGESDSGDGYGMPEEPRTSATTNRKYDDWGSSRRTSRAEERKKPSSSTPRGVFSSGSPFRSPRPKDSPRDSTRTYHSSRAKYRTKERQRETYDKYAAHDYSDYSDSSASSILDQVKRSATDARRATPDRPRAARVPVVDDDDDDDNFPPEDPHKSKHDIMEVTAQDYIKRSKRTTVEIDPRGHRPSRSPSGPREYESRRPKRSTEFVRPSNSRSGSYEHLDVHSIPPARLSREATSPVPGKYGSRPHPMRSATTASPSGFTRSKRDPDMAAFMRGGPKRQDSGYSSPGAADMGLHGSSPPKPSTGGSTRYKIVNDLAEGPSHPSSSSSRYQSRGVSPPPPRSMPVRSKTFAPEPSSSSSSRAARATPATSATRPLFGQVDAKDIKYGREYGPDADIPYRMHHPRGYSAYDDYPESSPGRRQSAFA